MFSNQALVELETRRQRLVATADGLRADLGQDLAVFVGSMGWADRAVGWLRGARPLLWVAAPAAGYWLARRGRTVVRWLPMVLPWWQVARNVGARLGRRAPRAS